MATIGQLTAQAVQRRNAAVHKRLADALRPVNLRGAPALPKRGPGGGKASNNSGAGPVSSAAVIKHYAFRDASRDSQSHRITRLASIAFASGVAGATVNADAAGTADGVSQELLDALAALAPLGDAPASVASSTSTSAVERAAGVLREYAAATLTSGFTWLVCDANGKLAVQNMPVGVSPLQQGLYPIACIDMTPEATQPSPAAVAASTTTEEAKPPAWSRAARNRAVKFETPAALVLTPPVSHLAPSALRERRAQECASQIDWAFVDRQFGLARAWFGSEARANAVAARRRKLEDAAKQRMPQRVEMTGEDDEAEDVSGLAEPAPAATTDTAAQEQQPPAAAEQQEPAAAAAATTEEAGASAETVTEAAAATPAEDVAELATEPVAATVLELYDEATSAVVRDAVALESRIREMPSGAGQTLEDGSVAFALDNGAYEYVRQDGTRAVVRADGTQEDYDATGALVMLQTPNGTQVFTTREASSDLARTVVQPDGTTTYEYRNGSSVSKLPDGRTRTTFADGTVVEEPAPAAAE